MRHFLNNSRLRAVLLVLAVAAAYVAWRAPGDLVWDDTPAVLRNIADGRLTVEDSFADPLFWELLVDPWRRAFSDGYRPLNAMVARFGRAWCASSPRAPIGLLVINGIVAGLLAHAYFRLARRFTRTGVAAAFSVFLLLASTPLLTGSLVLFRGIQALVPLTMCCTLLCYFAARESARRWPWLVCLAVLMFLGPWYREFNGITAILILAVELASRRWRGPIWIIASLGTLHALFPTALTHLLVFPELPVQPVYRLGVLAEQVRAGVTPGASRLVQGFEALKSLRWRVLLDLVNVLPPTLFVLAVAGWIATGLRNRAAAIAPRQAVFLGAFFLLTFLPFLKVFKLHVHLAYCLVPGSILLAASVEALWQAVQTRRAAALLCGALLALVIADHALNFFVVRGANLHCYAAVRREAEFCDRELPAGSVLIINAQHGYDIALRCGGRFPCYCTSPVGVVKAWRVPDRAALAELLEKAGSTEVYCLDVRLPRRSDQLGAGNVHWVVRDRPVEMVDYGEIDRVSYQYPIVDPLRWLMPVRNMTWPCSPDLQHDYYRGPVLGGPIHDGSPWLAEIAVSYYCFKVVGRQLDYPAAPATQLADERSAPHGPDVTLE
jgi:hypothetical protein